MKLNLTDQPILRRCNNNNHSTFSYHRGPYGVILRCQERATGRNFAAKFIDIEPGDADHIRKEIETHNHLQHPRLAQLHDAFETSDPNQFVLIYDL